MTKITIYIHVPINLMQKKYLSSNQISNCSVCYRHKSQKLLPKNIGKKHVTVAKGVQFVELQLMTDQLGVRGLDFNKFRDPPSVSLCFL